MKQRADAIGIFWQDYPVERRGRVEINRSPPPIPDTGWTPPQEFPDLSAAKIIAIDCETKDEGIALNMGPGVRRDDSYIAGISIGTDDGYRGYFPMRHELGGNLDPDTVLRWANDQLNDPYQDKIGANLLYDLDWLAEEGVTVQANNFLDVQVAEPLINENQRSFALETLAQKYLGEGKVAEELYKWTSQAYGGSATRKEQAGNIWRAPVELVGPYAESDVDLPLRIYEKQKVILSQQGLIDVFELESDLIPVLLMMRRHGVRIDVSRAEEVGHIMEVNKVKAQDLLNKAVGFDCNVWANAELARAFKKLSLWHPKTDKGNPSFTKDWLKSNSEPLCALILNVRKWYKAKGTFVDGLINHLHNGRIHGEFHQLKTDKSGTVTGRLSSSNPNLQNIPARDEEMMKLVRSFFLPDEGNDWWRYDWSQIEYRFLTHYARGQSGIDARRMYNEDPSTNFHRMTHDIVLERTGQDIAHKPIKELNFGLTYGMGKPKITRALGLTTQAGEDLFEAYHDSVPFVKETFNYAMQIANKRGYIKTILGRRRRFNKWESRDWEMAQVDGVVSENYARDHYGINGMKRAGTFKALNAVMQGGAAELMKKAMRDQHKAGVYDVLGPPLLTVHDELGLNGNKSKASQEAHKEVKHIMETAIKLKVPILVDVETGPNWANLKPVGD